VRLAIPSFYIILAQVPKIMYCEGDPQPDVPWGPEKASPSDRYKPEMQPKGMGAKEYASSPDGHICFPFWIGTKSPPEAAPLPTLTLAGGASTLLTFAVLRLAPRSCTLRARQGVLVSFGCGD
jgi:hypothetical protein